MSYRRIMLLKKDYMLNYINGKVIICILILLFKNSHRGTQQKLLLCLSVPLETGSSLAPLTIQQQYGTLALAGTKALIGIILLCMILGQIKQKMLSYTLQSLYLIQGIRSFILQFVTPDLFVLLERNAAHEMLLCVFFV